MLQPLVVLLAIVLLAIVLAWSAHSWREAPMR